MAVQRYDLNNCIGCENCITVCPMDVFRFDYEANKSVIAYPENCQGCAQCYVGCQGRSLMIAWTETRYGMASSRAAVVDTATLANIEEAIIAQPAKAEAEKAAAAASGSSSGSGGASGSGSGSGSGGASGSSSGKG